MEINEIENMEIQLLLEAIRLRCGYDFRNYAKASLKRRVLQNFFNSGCKTISDMIPKIIHGESLLESLLYDLSITVTEMFRDPSFYVALRNEIIPVLKTYPFIKIWHAGCATGEEVYSIAILLKEEGLYDRVHIYATDFNDSALKLAQEGIFSMENMKKYTANYQKAQGRKSLSDYYHGKYSAVLMDKSLRKNITFANHNLVTDGVFGEMNLVLCRNVMIYFDRTLQNRVFRLFRDSLCHNGFLCLGSKESLNFSDVREEFKDFVKKEKIYQRKRGHEHETSPE